MTTRHDPSVYEGYYLEELTGPRSHAAVTDAPSRSSATVSSAAGSPGPLFPTGGRCGRCPASRPSAATAGPRGPHRRRAARRRPGTLLEGVDHVVFAAGTAKPAESNEHPMHEIAANLGPLLAVLKAMRRTSVAAITLHLVGGHGLRPGRADADAGVRAAVADQRVRRPQGRLPSATSPCTPAPARPAPPTSCAVANVYGPGEPHSRVAGADRRHPDRAPARRPVVVYGDGSARRDFVHVDDVADAVVALAAGPDGVRVLNVGSGGSESRCSTSSRRWPTRSAPRRCWTTGPGRPTDVPVVSST